MTTILIVEDDKGTRAMIEFALESYGYPVISTGTLKGGLDLTERKKPGLIILDLNLPDGNGLELCRKIRTDEKLSAIPIIALTGKSKLTQKRKGFDCGLDQYLTKPLEVEELLMWVKALLRRVELGREAGPAGAFFEDVEINEAAHLVRFREQSICDLTKREFELFTALISASPRVFSREEILVKAWKTAAVPNLVDTHIHNLRNKLPPALALRIQSVPGKGFRYFSQNKA